MQTYTHTHPTISVLKVSINKSLSPVKSNTSRGTYQVLRGHRGRSSCFCRVVGLMTELTNGWIMKWGSKFSGQGVGGTKATLA